MMQGFWKRALYLIVAMAKLIKILAIRFAAWTHHNIVVRDAGNEIVRRWSIILYVVALLSMMVGSKEVVVVVGRHSLRTCAKWWVVVVDWQQIDWWLRYPWLDHSWRTHDWSIRDAVNLSELHLEVKVMASQSASAGIKMLPPQFKTRGLVQD